MRSRAKRFTAVCSVFTLILGVSILAIPPLAAEPCTTCIQWNSGVLGEVAGSPVVTCEWAPDYGAGIPPYENPALSVEILSKDDSGSTDPPRIGSVTWSNGVGDSDTVARASIPGLTPVQTDVDFTQENLGEQWVIVGPTIPEDPTGVLLTVEISFIDGGGSPTTPSDALANCNLLANVDQANPVFGSALLAISEPGTTTAAVAPVCIAGGLGMGGLAVNGDIDVLSVTGPDQQLIGQTKTGPTADDLTGAASRTSATVTNCVDPGPNLRQQYELSEATTWLALEMVLNPGESTVADLTSMRATRYEDGVRIAWRTGFEQDNVGFNLYRERNGHRQLLNTDLVAGSMLAFGDTLRAGYSYAWWDADGSDDATYWIEDVDASGRTTLHGPIAQRPSSGRGIATSPAPLLRDLASGIRSGAGPAPRRLVRPEAPAGSQIQAELAGRADALKLSVGREGLYRVTYRDLVAAGFDPSSVKPANFRLYANGVESALWERSRNDGSFDPGDWLAFYGWGRDDAYFGEQVFWLVEGDVPGLRMRGGRVGVPASEAEVATVDYPVLLEENLGYHAAILNGSEENFFGAIVASQPVVHELPALQLDPAGTGGFLELSIQGATKVAHEIAVDLNGIALGSIPVFYGQELKIHSFPIAAGQLLDGSPNLVTLTRISGDAADISLVESMTLTYPRRTTASDDQLIVDLSFADTGALRIDGFSRPPLPVFDVTDPARPFKLSGTVFNDGDSYGLALHPTRPQYQTPRRILALTGSAAGKPKVELNRPSTWSDEGNGADLMIVGHSSILESLQPLADLRSSEGLSVVTIDIEDVFDEQGFGMKSPGAIRDFVAAAVGGWQPAPRFLLLAGDASYDPRDYLGFGEDLVPTRLIDVGNFEAPTDDWLADLDQDGQPDLAVGRLPVRTPAEADLMVSKLVDYAGTSRGERGAMLVTDEEVPTFEDMSLRALERLPSGVPSETISVADLGIEAARSEILGGLDQGAWLVNYAGHGQIDYWNNDLLNSEDAAALANTGPEQLSFFTMMNCLNGYFVTPFIDSLGEALLRAPGGAMGVWSSSAITGVGSQHMLMTEFYDQLFAGSDTSLGEAAASAKGALRGSGRGSWVLLGDPSSRMQGDD